MNFHLNNSKLNKEFFIKKFNHNENDELNLKQSNEIPLAFSESIAEFVQDLLDEKFLVDDLSFIFEMSQKRTLSPCSILLAMIYLKRLKQNSSKICFSFSNTELCLVSLIVASKYLIDEGEINEIYNDEWAEVSNLPVKKINHLEKTMLNDLNWELYVSPNEFWTFVDKMHLLYISKKLQSQNGLCTYDDIKYLFENTYFLELTLTQFNYLYKTILICSATLLHLLYTSMLAYFLISSSLKQTTIKINNDGLIKDCNNQNQMNFIESSNNQIFINENNTNIHLIHLNMPFENIETNNLDKGIFESNSIKSNFKNTYFSSIFELYNAINV